MLLSSIYIPAMFNSRLSITKRHTLIDLLSLGLSEVLSKTKKHAYPLCRSWTHSQAKCAEQGLLRKLDFLVFGARGC